ncbi:hypothetical protein D3C73_789240 [compost metagenome]
MSFGIRNGERNPGTVSGNGDHAAEGVRAFDKVACCIIFIGGTVAQSIDLCNRAVHSIIAGE